MNGAKKSEADQWIGNAVFTIAKRAGVPKNRIMSMRWVCTWKKIDGSDEKQAKARLVVKGFTDPDLIKIRPNLRLSPRLDAIAYSSSPLRTN